MRWLRRAVVILAVGLAGAVALATPASAHAYLAASAPADGSILDRAPETVTLRFTEHVELAATQVAVVDGDGRHWAVTALVLRPAAGHAQDDAESPVDVVVGLPANLAPNVYHVAWQTLSSDDLHATSGTLVFGVQRPVTAGLPAMPAGPALRESIARGAALIAMSTLLGGAALALLLGLVPGRAEHRTVLRGRLLRISAGVGVIALICVPLQLVIQVAAAGGDWERLLAEHAATGSWVMHEGGILLLTLAVMWASRGARMGSPQVVVTAGAAGALLACAGTALSGHPMGAPATTVLTTGLHVLAAGGWAGGVVAAVAALVPLARVEPGRSEQVRSLLRAFSVLAIACVVALSVTGLVLTGIQVATWDALLTTPYGVLLMTKVVAVLAAGLLGLRTSLQLRHPDGLSQRRLRAEAAVLVGVLILAATLASAGPARGPQFPIANRIDTVPEVSGQAADLVDTLTVRPNLPGRNVLSVTVADTRRPAPAPIIGLSLRLTGPDGAATVHPVVRGDDGWTIVLDDIRVAGNWRIGVTVLRQGLPSVTDIHDWTVPPAASNPDNIVVSSAPVAPVTRALAVVITAAGVVMLGWWLRRRLRIRGQAASRPAVTAAGAPNDASARTVRIGVSDG